MNTKKGYVYILINPSLKGLLKIGQTKKDPEERAKEVSQGTGVPTPYIVAFKEEFNDCELAERMIHIMLEEEGCRVSKNREFFEAEISDIIRKILRLKEYFLNKEENDLDDDVDFSDNEDLFSDFEDVKLDESIYSNPWDNVESIAYNSYYGEDDELEDYDKAYEYYLKAYKLGSPTAAEKLGNMNKKGESVRENISLALNFYKEAIARGNTSCWANIGELYLNTNIQNSIKAYKKYFSTTQIDDKIYYNIFNPIFNEITYHHASKDIFNEIFLILKEYKEILLVNIIRLLEYSKEMGNRNVINFYESELNFIENNYGESEQNIKSATIPLINELRQLTGAGITDCKNALNKTGGDIEKAIQVIKDDRHKKRFNIKY